MTRILTILFILTIELGCSTTKGPYTYEICVEQEAKPSQIAKNEVIGKAGINKALLEGQIIEKDSKELLEFVNVSLTDTSTNKIYGQASDSIGEFSFFVPPGNYILRINFVGFQSIKENLKIEIGDVRELKIELVQGDAFVTYEIKSDKKLSKRQLRKKAVELKSMKD